jgi:formate dehydrogenase major subunit
LPITVSHKISGDHSSLQTIAQQIQGTVPGYFGGGGENPVVGHTNARMARLGPANVEKDGSVTNTQRLLQFQHQAVEPPGEARSDRRFRNRRPGRTQQSQ